MTQAIPLISISEFLVPDDEVLDFLLNNEASYRKYSLALAWIQDILLNHIEGHIRPYLTLGEAKHRYFEVLREPENEIFAENLSRNYARAIYLGEFSEKDKNLGKSMIMDFLDEMNDSLNHMSETLRTGNKAIMQKYLSQKAIQKAETEPPKLDEEKLKNFLERPFW